MSENEKKKENVSRRTAIQTIGGTVLGLAVGAAAGYLGKPTAPAETITTTETVTSTVSLTATAPPVTTGVGGFDWAKVGKPYSGQKVTILVESGTRMDKWLSIIAPDWKQMTGIDMEIVSLAFSQMGEAAMTDFLAGTGAYDIAYMVNFWVARWPWETTSTPSKT